MLKFGFINVVHLSQAYFFNDFVYHITERVSASWLVFQEENDLLFNIRILLWILHLD
ncbi:hypothetical protein DAPPUDRAFT_233764 [Daphnia pulex]|uniref:Uncharacterized protein n=1 Tax=Daphnia pulex TaxID=6669 RepID=E9FVN3_DAPPU|nr:hypothetical protein DAPPUDRAFT_233764 [Daphnia pulex]|eukprot:EFX89074.1 hypothetical protein DAPPUDRAFT_233764 [Daphnia pulex]